MRPIILSTENEYDAFFKILKDEDEERILGRLAVLAKSEPYLAQQLEWLADTKDRKSRSALERRDSVLLNILTHLFMREANEHERMTCGSPRGYFGDVWLYNGTRFYIDHYHPEYSAPECTSVRELLCHNLAGDLFVEELRKRIVAKFDLPDDVVLIKNNSAGNGVSFGAHENYLVSPELYYDLVRGRSNGRQALWIAFLISRQIIAGAGKIGCEFPNVNKPGQFELSQRSDVTFTVHSGGTMSYRPIINTRDEPHAEHSEHRRLHVIIGDANRSHWSNYLKFGTAMIVLQMLQEGFIQEEVIVENPVDALHKISCDLETFNETVSLAGRGKCSALDLQQFFLKKAKAFLERVDSAHKAEYADIVDKWEFVLDQFENGKHRKLAGYLDWVAKSIIAEHRAKRDKVAWSHENIKLLDVQYHYLNPERDMFSHYSPTLKMHEIVTPEDIRAAMTSAPLSRAFLRGAFLRHFRGNVMEVDWTKVCVRGAFLGGNEKIFSNTVYEMLDPLYPSTQRDAAAEEERVKALAHALSIK